MSGDLAERFERAYEQFAPTFFEKALFDRASLRDYTEEEFFDDLFDTAGQYGLFGESLWAYFTTLHPRPL